MPDRNGYAMQGDGYYLFYADIGLGSWLQGPLLIKTLTVLYGISNHLWNEAGEGTFVHEQAPRGACEA